MQALPGLAQIARKELELTAKGFTPQQIQIAIRRSINYANSFAGKMPTDIRERAFEAFLTEQLSVTESYLEGLSRAASSGRYERNIKEAVKLKRYQKGYEFQVPEGINKDIARRQGEGLIAQIETWKRKMTQRTSPTSPSRSENGGPSSAGSTQLAHRDGSA